MVTLVKFQQNFVGKQNPLSAVNGVVMYEASITQRSLLNQSGFLLVNTANLCDRIIPIAKSVEIAHPQVKFPHALIPIEIIGFHLRKFAKKWWLWTAPLVRLYLNWHKMNENKAAMFYALNHIKFYICIL